MTSERGAAAPQAARVATIDILRGLALCGILLIHVAAFALPGAPPGLGFQGSPLNEIILLGLIVFVDAKFFCLFALLFGISFAIQRASAERRGVPFAPMFRRRLLILGLIGCAHILLLWEGDILLLYAALGLVLIPLQDWPTRRLIRWAIGLIGVPLLLVGLAFGGLMLSGQVPAFAERITAAETTFSADFATERAAVVARYASSDALTGMRGRIDAYIAHLPLLLVRAPATLAMFLLGFAAGRAGVPRDLARYEPMLRRIGFWGLIGGLSLSLLITVAYANLPPFGALTVLGFNQVVAGPLLALGYAASFVVLSQGRGAAWLFGPLAGYGRMALTSYLLQSAICGLLFYGIGFGLVLEVPPAEALALALLINLVLIIGCNIWLRFFCYGPVEWLWRSLTLGKAQSFCVRQRVTEAQPAQPPRAAPGPRGALGHDTPFGPPHSPPRQ